ncbi:hypothetical protein [Lysinibacillus antri]|uniref:Branched-chain amino acid aminotransferase n=1 Tax=Lysinibacillus antri TaxID=2498145 RepID=A0A432L975_9BACI|nr:hypothetical protein [Lysinibacillus antri]RUL49872.1 hypothetical protein EK386_14445 [Lysinibacillus antri]
MTINLTDAYIERCDKETEDTIAQEQSSFLATPITYFKQHLNEFLYIESPTFEAVKIDAISLEVDDVFRTYMVLLGLKVQKKHTSTIKTFLEEHLHTTETKNYSAMFSGEDGLWELNIPIDFIEGFSESMTVHEALTLALQFIQKLIQTTEQNN